MKLQIKTDNVTKDTKNHLKFRKKLRKMLLQRDENREKACHIDSKIASFGVFDPLLDWKFRPVCGCELEGMEHGYYNVKHNSLFGRNGYLLYDEAITTADYDVMCAGEGYELWILDDLSLVFTYYCMVKIPRTDMKMIYRYPIGKKIPTDMVLNSEDFLNELDDRIYSLRHPE